MTTKIVTALAIEAAALAACLIVGLDLAAHRRVERLGGMNIWNYRGPVAHQKQPREIRLVVVGGTRAFGWGVAPIETVSGALAWHVRLATDRPGEPLRPVVGINLGRLGVLPPTYPDTIEHYAYLAPDYICIYDDLGVPGADGRAPSGVFELTRYMPALPFVAREKGAIWRGSESFGRRAAGRALLAAGDVTAAADRRLGQLVGGAMSPTAFAADGYVDAMMRAIDSAERHARGVLVAVSPAETDAQRRNLASLRARLEPRLSREPLRFVDLSQTWRLYDDELRLDGWNFGAGGNAVAAEAIAPALLELIAPQS